MSVGHYSRILLAVLLVFVLEGTASAEDGLETNYSFTIDNATKEFRLDGKPFRYISGSIHYFRVHPALWADRLQRMRAAGLNAIQFYIPWNFHEVYEGKIRFDKSANVTRFLQLASDNELFVLVRLGPYVCGEWDNGGVPWWLLKYKDIQFRSSDKRYLKAVERWFGVLLPVLRPFLRKNGGPILMLQIENEYGSFGCDHVYTQFLRDLAFKHLGNDVILYTTDGAREDILKCGSVPGVFATVDFGPWEEDVEEFFRLQRKFAPNGPLVNSEFYPGWFLVWSDVGHFNPSVETIMNATKRIYAIGANFNYYMFHGGTNFAFWNGATAVSAVITSYDYRAPISEAGDITEKYVAIRDFISTIPNWPNPPKELPTNSTKFAYGQVRMRKVGPLTSPYLLKVASGLCVRSRFPLTFEKLLHPYGFMVYRTILGVGGRNLSIPLIKDHGYVFVDEDFQGMMYDSLGELQRRWLAVGATKGSVLTVVVENRGRDARPVTDFKGIVSNVSLDGVVIEKWEQCPIRLPFIYHDLMKPRSRSRLLSKEARAFRGERGTPGVYLGRFETDTPLLDTFVDMRGWGKGQLIVNGFNVGRYWPDVGPQMSLYVPATVIRRWNTVILVELIGSSKCATRSCPLKFIDHPVINTVDWTPGNLTHSVFPPPWSTAPLAVPTASPNPFAPLLDRL